MMKSMMLTGLKKMEMVDVPMPAIKNDTDVMIKMQTIGVCGSDIHYYNTGKIGSQVVKYPFPVGHEGAGIVVETGSRVASVKKGDRIAIEPAMHCGECDQCRAGRKHTCRKLKFLGCPGQADGCLSEYIVMPESSCFPVPDTISFDQATISEPLAIGIYAVKRAAPLENRSVGILGHGPIGMSVLLGAKAWGAGKTYVTDKINERLILARKCGANYTGNPVEENITRSIIQKEPLLLDVVFECCGKQEAIYQAIDLVKPGGTIFIIGIPEFSKWSFPVDDLRRKEISIQNIRRQVDCVEAAITLMGSNSINVDDMITHRFPFNKSREAFDFVSEYKDGVMKAIIDFDR